MNFLVQTATGEWISPWLVNAVVVGNNGDVLIQYANAQVVVPKNKGETSEAARDRIATQINKARAVTPAGS